MTHLGLGIICFLKHSPNELDWKSINLWGYSESIRQHVCTERKQKDYRLECDSKLRLV